MTAPNPFEDSWFLHNTLPYVIPYLNMNDILSVSKASPLWASAIHECYLSKYFVPVCYTHRDEVVDAYGSNICCLQVIPSDREIMQLWQGATGNPKPNQSNSKLFDSSNEIFKHLNLTHLRYYEDYYWESKHPCYPSIYDSHWTVLLTFTNLKYLELRLHIPSAFGTAILRHLEYLEVLKLYPYSGVDEHLFEAISRLKRLKELVVLKASVNSDFCQFLPALASLQELAMLIRAPCDTNYYLLMQALGQLRLTLKHFRWMLDEVTMCVAFFGENCCRLLDLKSFDSIDREVLKSCLAKRLAPTKVTVDDTSMYFHKMIRNYGKCFKCIA